MRRRMLAAVVCLVAATVTAALACGPFFPSSILDNDYSVMDAPVADFSVELRRIDPPIETSLKANRPERPDGVHTQAADLGSADLAMALEKRGLSVGDSNRIRAARREYRAALDAWRSSLRSAMETGVDQSLAGAPDLPALPDDMPAEFSLYLRGAAAYYAADHARARQHWSAILELPEEQRRFRATWAAYMIGRSLLESDRGQAVAWFARTRSLAADGYHDSLGLAAASLGWEARAHLDRQNFAEAVALYLAQWQTGDETATASLALVARRTLEADEERLRQAARDPAAQQVITAWLIAKGGALFYVEGPDVAMTQRWLTAVEQVEARRVAGADRLAWAAYQGGAYDVAERWLARAAADAPMAHWIRAKLRMRAGDRDGAAAALSRATALLPAEATWPETAWRNRTMERAASIRPQAEANAELGALHLGRGQFVEALDALMRADYWQDAAYVADSVLRVDELKAYVDRAAGPERAEPQGSAHPDAEHAAENPYDWWLGDPKTRDQGLARDLRHLLARRLTRLGRGTEARAYFPQALRDELDAYLTYTNRGRDKVLPPADRAEALWQAALLARHHGIDLLATELDPDSAITGGDFERFPYRPEPEASPLIAPQAEERERAAAHRPTPDKRWHYRYVALDYAWAALALMPDNTEETARRFIIAGSWVKGRDPEAADRFYKALVRRCGTTDLGREADKLRWFPELEKP